MYYIVKQIDGIRILYADKSYLFCKLFYFDLTSGFLYRYTPLWPCHAVAYERNVRIAYGSS